MDLEEFVSETLRKIIAGVKAAQEAADGANVNAAGFEAGEAGNLIFGSVGAFTRVDFDVAVTAETSGGGKASIRVWGVGGEAGREKMAQTVSRVQFSVPVRLPDGDQSRSKAEKDRWNQAEKDAARGPKGMA